MTDENETLRTSHGGVQSIEKVKMIRCDVLFNHNELMATGFGNSKKQAERNASINGLKWLRVNKLLSHEQVSCSGVGVKKAFESKRLHSQKQAQIQGQEDVEMEDQEERKY